MKKILPFLLVLLSLVSFGQTNSIYKGSASVNADSAVFRNIVSNLQSTYGDIGALYYNRESSKWRIFADSVWRDLVVPDSLGNILTAYNGLTLSNDSISLEGTLVRNTTLIGDNNNLSFQGVDSLFLDSDQILLGTDSSAGFSRTIRTEGIQNTINLNIIAKNDTIGGVISLQSKGFNWGTTTETTQIVIGTRDTYTPYDTLNIVTSKVLFIETSDVADTDTTKNIIISTGGTRQAPTSQVNTGDVIITTGVAGTGGGGGFTGNIIIDTQNFTTGTLKINGGDNEQCGTATLIGGTVIVNNTKITANSIVILTNQSLGTVVIPSSYSISARIPGTSFTILASDPTDTSVIGWFIIEPN